MEQRHQRQVIREWVTAELCGKTAAGERVFPTRKVPLRRVELPAIAVYALSESVEEFQVSPRVLRRSLQLGIETLVETDSLDDTIDSISHEIERVMHADPTLGGTAEDSVLTSTEIDVFEDGNKPVAAVRLEYSVVYLTDAPAACDVALDDLRAVMAETSLGSEDVIGLEGP